MSINLPAVEPEPDSSYLMGSEKLSDTEFFGKETPTALKNSMSFLMLTLSTGRMLRMRILRQMKPLMVILPSYDQTSLRLNEPPNRLRCQSIKSSANGLAR